jgi:capsular polysaccharide transport system ATP-binding protein
MILLEDVSKHYLMRGGRRKEVLNGLNGVIRPGDTVGILGRNGAGKSTLLRILAGVEHPSSGRVQRSMSVSWPLAHGMGLHSSMSGADNARFVARLYGVPVKEMLDFVEGFAELGPYFYMPLSTYSSGMNSRVTFAISLAIDFDCYLIDEGISTGDQRFVARARQIITDRLRNRSVIMVTHSVAHVRTFCRTAAVLSDGKLKFYEDLDEAIATYEAL